MLLKEFGNKRNIMRNYKIQFEFKVKIDQVRFLGVNCIIIDEFIDSIRYIYQSIILSTFSFYTLPINIFNKGCKMYRQIFKRIDNDIEIRLLNDFNYRKIE